MGLIGLQPVTCANCVPVGDDALRHHCCGFTIRSCITDKERAAFQRVNAIFSVPPAVAAHILKNIRGSVLIYIGEH